MDLNLHPGDQHPNLNLSYDGTATDRHSRRGPVPSVRLPPQLNQLQPSTTGTPSHSGQSNRPIASVSVPATSYAFSTQSMLSPRSPHTLRDDAFPKLGDSNPIMRPPKRLAQPSQEDRAKPQIGQPSGSLEDRMRSLIMQNDAGASVDSESNIVHTSTKNLPRGNQRIHQKPARGNQAERKRRAAQDGNILTTSDDQRPHEHRPNPRPNTDQPPHLRQSRNHTSYDDISRQTAQYSREARQSWRGGINTQTRPSGPNYQTQSQHRPPPQHHQLFNPNGSSMANGSLPNRQYLGQGRTPEPASIHDQLLYIKQFAESEIADAEITPEELEAKQQLGQVLTDICRQTVSNFEMKENADFTSESVDLKPFGSLATTFATKRSDMDLVLVSPQSKTNASSIESPLPRLVEKALLDAGFGVRLLTRTRVPIIKFCSEPTVELAARLKEARMKWEKEQGVLKANAKANGKDKRMPQSLPEPTIVAAKSVPLVATRPSPKPAAGTLPIVENSEDATSTASAVDSPTLPTRQEVSTEIDDPNPPSSKTNKTSGDQSTGPAPTSSTASVQSDLSTMTFQEGERPDKGVLRQAQAAQALDHAEKEASEGHESVRKEGERASIATHHTAGGGPTINEPAGNLEQDDPDISQKSDDERIRLYRLAMGEEWYEPSERILIYAFMQAVESNSKVAVVEEARDKLKTLPNVLKRYKEPKERTLEYPKEGVGIQCDINFSNLLALHNSALLRCYSLCDKRVRLLVLFVKVWAKKRKINSGYESTLCSYGYVLMVLHYLMNVASPPIIPNLQHFFPDGPYSRSSQPTELDGYNIRFYRNEDELSRQAYLGHLPGAYNPASLETLIRGFFYYYGGNDNFRTFSWMKDCLSLRSIGGIVSKESKGWTAAKTEIVNAAGGPKETKDIRQRYLIAIEDPFETHHNVGRTVSHDGICAIRDEFRRAHNMITHAGHPGPNGKREYLMEEHAGRPNLHYRYFGPRPRKRSDQQQKPQK